MELDTKKRAQKVADKATSICAKREVTGGKKKKGKKRSVSHRDIFHHLKNLICLWNVLTQLYELGAENVILMQVNNVPVHVMQGDPRNVMTEAVERFHPTILVLGSHGYGAVKRYKIYATFKFDT